MGKAQLDCHSIAKCDIVTVWAVERETQFNNAVKCSENSTMHTISDGEGLWRIFIESKTHFRIIKRMKLKCMHFTIFANFCSTYETNQFSITILLITLFFPLETASFALSSGQNVVSIASERYSDTEAHTISSRSTGKQSNNDYLVFVWSDVFSWSKHVFPMTLIMETTPVSKLCLFLNYDAVLFISLNIQSIFYHRVSIILQTNCGNMCRTH